MKLRSKPCGASNGADHVVVRFDRAGPVWLLNAAVDFERLFGALPLLLPAESYLYLEDGNPSGALCTFIQSNAVPCRLRIQPGTRWPRPAVKCLPATASILRDLHRFAQCHAAPEFAVHFHVYHSNVVLLEWYDAAAPRQPILLSKELDHAAVERFAQALGVAPEEAAPEDL